MSWSPELFIGELRPWPDSVHVVRGKTDEIRRYVPERTCHEVWNAKEQVHELSCCGRDAWLSGVYFCPMCGARIDSSTVEVVGE